MTTFFYQQAWNFLDLTRMASVISSKVKKLWLDRQKRDTVNYSAAVIQPNAKLAKVCGIFPPKTCDWDGTLKGRYIIQKLFADYPRY